MSDKPLFVYLASPYTHDDPKVMQARRDAVFAAVRRLRTHETIVFSPIVALHPYALVDGPGTWETWAEEDRHAILARDELWVYQIPGWDISKGVEAERAIAETEGKPIKFIEPTVDELAILRGTAVGDPAPRYFPTPEETAQCGYCGFRGNVTEFWPDGVEGAGSECPDCEFVEDSPPTLDQEDIAAEAASGVEWFDA